MSKFIVFVFFMYSMWYSFGITLHHVFVFFVFFVFFGMKKKFMAIHGKFMFKKIFVVSSFS